MTSLSLYYWYIPVSAVSATESNNVTPLLRGALFATDVTGSLILLGGYLMRTFFWQRRIILLSSTNAVVPHLLSMFD